MMSPEEEFELREDVAALIRWRDSVNQRLNFVEEYVTDPAARAELRRLRSMRQIQEVRDGRE